MPPTNALDTERKLYVFYKGQPAEWLRSAVIFGKTYYDIRLQNGMVKTVPASSTTKEKESKNDNNTIKL